MKVRTSGGPLTVDLTLTPIEKVQSPYQQLIVGEAEIFGKLLLLDGEVQFAESDEHIFHEMFAYPPLILAQPERALILGGGDGLLARRLIDENVHVTIVDIDKAVVDLCKKHFYALGSSALDEAELIISDALQYRADKPFDVLFLDLPDINDVPHLYDERAFAHYIKLLRDNGLLVVHSDYYRLPSIVRVVGKHFRHVFSYAAYVPSFFSLWTFAVFSNRPLDDSALLSTKKKGKYFSADRLWKYQPGLIPDTEEVETVELID